MWVQRWTFETLVRLCCRSSGRWHMEVTVAELEQQGLGSMVVEGCGQVLERSRRDVTEGCQG